MSFKRRLWTLSGDDRDIIGQCSARRQTIFAAIGLFVGIIFVLCFLSACYTFVMLFQSLWTGIPAGLFFAFMTTNIYLLLLYTLSRNVIPHVESRANRFLSVAIRIGFIVFIAVVVAKPLEVYLLSDIVAGEVEQFKAAQLANYRRVSEEDLHLETEQLEEAIARDLRNNEGINSPSVLKSRELIAQHAEEQLHSVNRMATLVGDSNYFIRSIALLNTQHPICWFITLLVAIVFAIPAVLKRRTPKAAKFYQEKERIEVGLVLGHYALFKEHYGRLFRELHNERFEFVELFEDPPFNTIRKADDREFLTQDSLLREIYDA